MENLLSRRGNQKHGSQRRRLIPGCVTYDCNQDIAAVADLMEQGGFVGKSTRSFLYGNLTMSEATTALGRAIGKDDLKYVQFPYDDVRSGLLGLGSRRRHRPNDRDVSGYE
jgi:hypothetical protein